jgi:hypothetical protein
VQRAPVQNEATIPLDVEPHDVEPSLVRGVLWTVGSQVALQAIRLGSVVVLARLLSPNDYGLAALAIWLSAEDPVHS